MLPKEAIGNWSPRQLADFIEQFITNKQQPVEPSAGGSAHIIQDHGTDMTARGHLNFTGDGVTMTDVPGTDRTNVYIPDGFTGTGVRIHGYWEETPATQTSVFDNTTSAWINWDTAWSQRFTPSKPFLIEYGYECDLKYEDGTPYQIGADAGLAISKFETYETPFPAIYLSTHDAYTPDPPDTWKTYKSYRGSSNQVLYPLTGGSDPHYELKVNFSVWMNGHHGYLGDKTAYIKNLKVWWIITELEAAP